MIIYHPRNDIYHCMFRFITIANIQDLEEFDFTRLRIYDLYFLFPHFVREIVFPRMKGVAALINRAAQFYEPYESLPDKKRLFSEMGDYHIQALQVLLAKDVFKETSGKLSIGPAFQSKSVAKLLSENQYISNNFYGDLLRTLNQIRLSGDSGLKKRTGLMEYRYDAI